MAFTVVSILASQACRPPEAGYRRYHRPVPRTRRAGTEGCEVLLTPFDDIMNSWIRVELRYGSQ